VSAVWPGMSHMKLEKIRVTHEKVDTNAASASGKEKNKDLRVRFVVLVHQFLTDGTRGIAVLPTCEHRESCNQSTPSPSADKRDLLHSKSLPKSPMPI